MRYYSKPGIFYGWWIVLVSAIGFALYGGFYFYGFSTFFMPLVNEFGWSRTAVSGAFSLSRIEGGLLGPIGGFLVDKFGPRKMMFLGMTLMGAGFILFSRIDSLIAFYLVFLFFVAMGATLGIHQAATVATINWFIKKRGTAIGLAYSGMGLGGILTPVLAGLIVQNGWRSTSVIIGLFIWAIGIPLSSVLRHRPEQSGYLPDGEAREESVTRREVKAGKTGQTSPTNPAPERTSAGDVSFTVRQALRTKVFWLLGLIFGLRIFVINGIVVHQIPFLIDIGISPALAAAALGSLALISIAGRLGFGRLADVLDKRYVMAICLAFTSAGCLILANAQSWWQIIAFLVIYSPAYGGGASVMFAIKADYFGRKQFGTIAGFMDLVQMFGTFSGPVFAGWIFDVTGNYRIAFTSFAIVATVAMILMLIARRPARFASEYGGGELIANS